MIFRSEEPNIKSLTLEARGRAHENRVNYRAEIPRGYIERAQMTLQGAIDLGDWQEFGEWGRLLKYLDIEMPKMTQKERNRMSTQLRKDLRLESDDLPHMTKLGQHFSYLKQIDPKYLKWLDATGKKKFADVLERYGILLSVKSGHSWESFAIMKTLNPSYIVHPDGELVSRLDSRLPRNILGGWLYVLDGLKNLAEARLAGVPVPKLTDEDWQRVRQNMQGVKQDGDLHRTLLFAFYSRILGADSVVLDESGLHITDLKPLPIDARPLPTSRHL